jgi:phage terminase small subunit
MIDPLAPPAHLPPPTEAAWLELADQLEWTADTDAAGLEAMATALARARTADARIAADGEYLTHPNGHVYPHPAIRVSQRSWSDFRAWAQRFRLTPADRGEKRPPRSLERSIADLIGPSPRSSSSRQAEAAYSSRELEER